MTPHTYELYLSRFTKAWLVFFAVFSVGVPIFLLTLALRSDGFPLPVMLIFPAALAVPWYFVISLPYRINVRADQEIEFVSLVRRRTAHAGHITSVRPHGYQFGFLVVRHRGGRVLVVNQFTGFHKLLSQLEAANPGVELLGC